MDSWLNRYLLLNCPAHSLFTCKVGNCFCFWWFLPSGPLEMEEQSWVVALDCTWHRIQLGKAPKPPSMRWTVNKCSNQDLMINLPNHWKDWVGMIDYDCSFQIHRRNQRLRVINSLLQHEHQLPRLPQTLQIYICSSPLCIDALLSFWPPLISWDGLTFPRYCILPGL